MAELVAALFAGAATAAPAAAGTAAAVSTTAAVSSTALSVLQGVATAGQVLFTLASGLSQAGAEDRAARAEAQRIKREELIRIGQLRVAFAGSGIDISSGQPATLEGNIRDQSEFEIGMARTSGRQRAGNALLAAAGDAFGAATGTAIDIARRG